MLYDVEMTSWMTSWSKKVSNANNQGGHSGEVKKPKYGPEKNPEKTQDEFNAVTLVLSSTHHGKHQGAKKLRLDFCGT